MEPNKDKEAEDQAAKDDSQAPADALSRTPDDLGDEAATQAAASPEKKADGPAEKKLSPLTKLFRKVNLYFLLFMVVVVIAGVVAAVNYLNSTKPEPVIDIENQALTQDALKQLANTDATVGNTSQTLTIQGNAVIAGQTLTRGNLNVAGNFQTGGSIQGASLTISGTSNLGEAQINNLQVATNVAVQGSTTLRELSVSGSSTFSGPVTASQLTVTRLVLSGNASLQVPGHLSFTGPSPSRTITSSTLGSGGTLSISGSDTSGVINISTGGSPQPGCFARINFQQAFTGQPRVIVSPVGSGAGQTDYYVDRNNSGFSICTANAAPANRAFSFDYFVAG